MKWIIILLLVIVACARAPEDIDSALITNVTHDLEAIEKSVGYAKVREIDAGLSTFLVEGYVLGVAQLARFEQLIGKVELSAQDEIVGVAAIVRSDSLVTDLRLLDEELKGDVLNVDSYEIISFRSSTVNNQKIIGELTFRGISKEVEILIENNQALRGEFLLDLKEFGVEKKGLDSTVRIIFDLVYKER